MDRPSLTPLSASAAALALAFTPTLAHADDPILYVATDKGAWAIDADKAGHPTLELTAPALGQAVAVADLERSPGGRFVYVGGGSFLPFRVFAGHTTATFGRALPGQTFGDHVLVQGDGRRVWTENPEVLIALWHPDPNVPWERLPSGPYWWDMRSFEVDSDAEHAWSVTGDGDALLRIGIETGTLDHVWSDPDVEIMDLAPLPDRSGVLAVGYHPGAAPGEPWDARTPAVMRFDATGLLELRLLASPWDAAVEVTVDATGDTAWVVDPYRGLCEVSLQGGLTEGPFHTVLGVQDAVVGPDGLLYAVTGVDAWRTDPTAGAPLVWEPIATPWPGFAFIADVEVGLARPIWKVNLGVAARVEALADELRLAKIVRHATFDWERALAERTIITKPTGATREAARAFVKANLRDGAGPAFHAVVDFLGDGDPQAAGTFFDALLWKAGDR